MQFYSPYYNFWPVRAFHLQWFRWFYSDANNRLTSDRPSKIFYEDSTTFSALIRFSCSLSTSNNNVCSSHELTPARIITKNYKILRSERLVSRNIKKNYTLEQKVSEDDLNYWWSDVVLVLGPSCLDLLI